MKRTMTLLLSALSLLLGSCGKKPATASDAPPPASVLTLSAAGTTTEQDYTASIEGKADLEIRPQVEGYLKHIYVDEGAFVRAGQPLFKIDDQPFREQINTARASQHAAAAAILNARLEVDKLTPLVQHKVVSEIQLKAAQAALESAQASAEQAKAQLAAAQINMAYTLIKAPANGYIGRLPRKQGALVSRNDPEALTRLSDVHEIYAYFSLSEQEFTQFKAQYAGHTLEEKLQQVPPVSLILAGDEQYPVSGKIDMIDGRFDRNTGSILLRAVFDNKGGLIRSGNTGKVRLLRHHDQAVLVPQSATLDVQDKVFVYIVDKSNKVSKQAIAVSGKSGDRFLVSSGLKAGDRIVTSGLDHLREGMEVQPESGTAKTAGLR